MRAYGMKTWYIPDMYWPEHTSPGLYVSHESICLLNTSDINCSIIIDLYYEDRDPIEHIVEVNCEARRTKHIRMDSISDHNGKPIPRGVAYAAVITCEVPCVVQYTRVDTTQCENSIMTTMGYPVD